MGCGIFTLVYTVYSDYELVVCVGVVKSRRRNTSIICSARIRDDNPPGHALVEVQYHSCPIGRLESGASSSCDYCAQYTVGYHSLYPGMHRSIRGYLGLGATRDLPVESGASFSCDYCATVPG